MQKWEYTTLSVNVDTVLTVNSKKVGEIKVGFLSGVSKDGPTLHDTLSHMGQEGWEVCGASPNWNGGGERPGPINFVVILKRPIA